MILDRILEFEISIKTTLFTRTLRQTGKLISQAVKHSKLCGLNDLAFELRKKTSITLVRNLSTNISTA